MLYVVLCEAYHSVKSYHLRFSGLTTLVWEEGASFLHSIINRLFVVSVLHVLSIYIYIAIHSLKLPNICFQQR